MNLRRVAIHSILVILFGAGGLRLFAQMASNAPQPSGIHAAVRTTYYREKSTHFRIDRLRSGAIRTANGQWNVQDFAHSLFNPNLRIITVQLKMVSDDPKFVFANGQVGTFTKTYQLKPIFGVTDNVYLCPVFERFKPNWPISSKSNFTGSVEFTSARPFYYFLLHETPEGVSPDLVTAYFMAWDQCEYDEPAVWDHDLRKLVIQYTNYWHDETTWRVGWHSELEITNNTDQFMTYTLDHIPYYGGQYDPATRQVTKYKEQVVQLALKPHEGKTLTLMRLFGWGNKMSSMEGCLFVTPGSAAGFSGTSARLLIIPNHAGVSLHDAIQ